MLLYKVFSAPEGTPEYDQEYHKELKIPLDLLIQEHQLRIYLTRGKKIIDNLRTLLYIFCLTLGL